MRAVSAHWQRWRPAWISPGWLVLAAIVFVATDIGDQLSGGGSFVPSGPLDETAHLLTTLIVLWAVGRGAFDRLLGAALVASVAIDLDHIPEELGGGWLTAGTPRPYTHSLLTIAIVLAGAWLWPRRRILLLAVAAGLALHFWRDMAEPGSGVALLWPFSDASFSIPPVSYLGLMTVAFLAGMRRSLRIARARRPPAEGARRWPWPGLSRARMGPVFESGRGRRG
jgi:inner membrane protein